MALFSDRKPEKPVDPPSGAPHSTAAEDDVSDARPSAEPSAQLAGDGLDAELPDIVELVLAMDQTPDEEVAESAPSPALRPAQGVPAHLEQLADQARKYIEAASSANTRRAYAADWKQFCAWARRQGFEVFPPDPQMVGL